MVSTAARERGRMRWCDGAGNACKGTNDCKGEGFVDVSSADACLKKGGKVVEPKKM